MTTNPPLHYWDACTFLHIIKGNEPDGGNILHSLVKDVKEGRLRIITSTFTIAEVVKPKKGNNPLSKSDEAKIKDVFTTSILIYELTRKIAERARELQWELGIKPPDAVHLATAETAEIKRFDTYDDKLIKKVRNGHITWNHKFDIGHPEKTQEELLF